MAKLDIYQAVTDRILEILDKGTVPWRHPISGSRGSREERFPRNLDSGKRYRGVNVFLLAVTSWMQGYESAYWLTYRQAKKRGGQVRQGEKASLVIFWKQYTVKDKETGEDKTVPVIRHYNVFNAQQCKGIKAPDDLDVVAPDAGTPVFEPIDEAEWIVAGYRSPPSIEHGGSRAFYRPTSDMVRIARPDRFESREAYYATLFHELAHSTGHKSRLNRGLGEKLSVFGSADYSKEELIAEMGAAFLAAAAGISPPTIDQSAAYIDGWRKKIHGDKKLVVQAAGAGQRAADHILGVTWDNASDNHESHQKPSHSTQTAMIDRETTTHEVDPARLQNGCWSHEKGVELGEGDIAGSYSADVIAMKGRVRRPFTFHGVLWVCVGIQNAAGRTACAYRLLDPDSFGEDATTYDEKTSNAGRARNDPMGFYHGMTVRCGGRDYVLAGPPVQFVEGSDPQPGLFAEL